MITCAAGLAPMRRGCNRACQGVFKSAPAPTGIPPECGSRVFTAPNHFIHWNARASRSSSKVAQMKTASNSLPRPVPHLTKKWQALFEYAQALNQSHPGRDLPINATQLGRYIAKRWPHVAGASTSQINAIRSGADKSTGTYELHTVILEVFLGEGAWPMPEYFDVENTKRDAGLDEFRWRLFPEERPIRFVPFENNENYDLDPALAAAHLRYRENLDCYLDVSLGRRPCEAQSGRYDGETVCYFWIKNLTILFQVEHPEKAGEISAVSTGRVLHEPSFVTSRSFRTSSGALGWTVTVEPEADEPFNANERVDFSTSTFNHERPSIDHRGRLVLSSTFPHFEPNEDLIVGESDEARAQVMRDLRKIFRNHLANRLGRRPRTGADQPSPIYKFDVCVQVFKPDLGSKQ